MSCPDLAHLVDQLDAGRLDPHVHGCAACRSLAHDLGALRGQARSLARREAGGELDVERALAAVLARGSRPRRRRARGRRALQAFGTAAAAVLVASLGAPWLLRLRVERPEAFYLGEAPAPAAGHVVPGVFWTPDPAVER